MAHVERRHIVNLMHQISTDSICELYLGGRVKGGARLTKRLFLCQQRVVTVSTSTFLDGINVVKNVRDGKKLDKTLRTMHKAIT